MYLCAAGLASEELQKESSTHHLPAVHILPYLPFPLSHFRHALYCPCLLEGRVSPASSAPQKPGFDTCGEGLPQATLGLEGTFIPLSFHKHVIMSST